MLVARIFVVKLCISSSCTLPGRQRTWMGRIVHVPSPPLVFPNLSLFFIVCVFLLLFRRPSQTAVDIVTQRMRSNKETEGFSFSGRSPRPPRPPDSRVSALGSATLLTSLSPPPVHTEESASNTPMSSKRMTLLNPPLRRGLLSSTFNPAREFFRHAVSSVFDEDKKSNSSANVMPGNCLRKSWWLSWSACPRRKAASIPRNACRAVSFFPPCSTEVGSASTSARARMLQHAVAYEDAVMCFVLVLLLPLVLEGEATLD